MITTEDKVTKALEFLAKTDKSHAEAKAMSKYLDQKRKTVKAVQYQESVLKTDKARESEAYSSSEYIAVCEEIKNAEYDYQILTNQRLRATLTIDVWRSENANRRNGNV